MITELNEKNEINFENFKIIEKVLFNRNLNYYKTSYSEY